MAHRFEPNKVQLIGYAKWCKTRPYAVRKLAERFPPWELLRMKSTGQRVFVAGINEDGTVSVVVSGDYNLTLHDRHVFGINPDDLEPCELPHPDEPVGAMMTGQEVDDNIDALRVLIRPDLFVMGADGKAVRKQ